MNDFAPLRPHRVATTHRLVRVAALASVAAAGAFSLTGCQSSIGGQTLPSPYYLRDDVQYFPAGPEFQFPNQVKAIEEYQLRGIGSAADGVAAPRNP